MPDRIDAERRLAAALNTTGSRPASADSDMVDVTAQVIAGVRIDERQRAVNIAKNFGCDFLANAIMGGEGK